MQKTNFKIENIEISFPQQSEYKSIAGEAKDKRKTKTLDLNKQRSKGTQKALLNQNDSKNQKRFLLLFFTHCNLFSSSSLMVPHLLHSSSARGTALAYKGTTQ